MRTMTIAALLLLIAQAAAASPEQFTGYAQCDKFIQMKTECIKTKAPPSERADELQELGAFRIALTLIPGSVADVKCVENIRLEMQRDRYGCYAAQAARAGVATACSLVTRADLQVLLGADYTEGQPGSSKCSYARADGAPQPVILEVRWTDGHEELKGARALAPPADSRAAQESVVAGWTIKGLGDDAFLLQAGFMPMLHVRRGDA